MFKHLKLWRLHKGRKKSDKYFSKQIDQATGDEQGMLIAEAMDVRDEQRDEILNLNTRLLSDEAEYLGIVVPPLSDEESWVAGRVPGTVRLTLQAQSQLRQAIRNEQKEKWSLVAFFLKEVAAPLMGVVGVIMGLLSLIHSFKSK
jgi:hypothetical protein